MTDEKIRLGEKYRPDGDRIFFFVSLITLHSRKGYTLYEQWLRHFGVTLDAIHLRRIYKAMFDTLTHRNPLKRTGPRESRMEN